MPTTDPLFLLGYAVVIYIGFFLVLLLAIPPLSIFSMLTEMSTRNMKIIIMFLGSKVRQVRRADNLTAICEPNVWTMWDP
jgi:hypothetical protein